MTDRLIKNSLAAYALSDYSNAMEEKPVQSPIHMGRVARSDTGVIGEDARVLPFMPDWVSLNTVVCVALAFRPQRLCWLLQDDVPKIIDDFRTVRVRHPIYYRCDGDDVDWFFDINVPSQALLAVLSCRL